MKEKMLKQLYNYSKSEKMYYLDIQLEDYRDAYSSWDYSPFINRDLDEDLLEYIMSCSYEIPIKKNMTIRLHLLNQLKDEKREKKSVEGIYNYFDYKIRVVKNEQFRMIRKIVGFFIIGTILLLAATFVKHNIDNLILNELLSEGLFIGGWVMIWEMFSIWFFQINRLFQDISHYRRIKKTKIFYIYSNQYK